MSYSKTKLIYMNALISFYRNSATDDRDNSFQEISFDVENSTSVEIDFVGSGALTGIDFSSQVNGPYSKIYVFGDSLSDTGNLFNATSFAQESLPLFGLDIPVLPPSPPYFAGRLSSGPLWIDKLADELNIELTPATELSVVAPGSNIPSPVTLIDGNPVVSPFFEGNATNQSVNFAFALAQTGANGSSELGDFVPGMERQVEFFVNDHLQAEQAADKDALYILWGGSNDYLSSDVDPEVVVENLETEIESLYGVGARDFLVVNLPDLGMIPEANSPDLPASPEELTEIVETHNSLLDSTVDELKDSLSGANLTILDVNSVFDEVIENPEEFGLTNVSEPFLDPITLTPTAGANLDEYFFYDTIHPTEAGHELVFNSALETLGIESEILL
jgi:phospholipase/lecithinase/hemolysin